MTSWPYVHTASAAVTPEGQISVAGPEPAAVTTVGFRLGGVADMGSPETLMVCALAWSLAATFRAETAAAGIPWDTLEITVDGTLDQNRDGPRFSRFDVNLALDARTGDQGRIEHAGQRALAGCLVANSLAARAHVRIHIRSRDGMTAAASTRFVAGDGIASHA